MQSSPKKHRQLLFGAATATALVLSGCASVDHSAASLLDGPAVEQSPVFEGAHDVFQTRPDLTGFSAEVHPGPAADDAYEGLVMLSPRDTEAEEQVIANAIMDENGDPLWLQSHNEIDDAHDAVHNLLVQDYGGEPVLTWWEGYDLWSHGQGEVVMVDSSYQEINRLQAGRGLVEGGADFHEFRITEDDTMLWVAYVPTQTDLSEIGGPEDGWVTDGVVQEIDIDTGEVLFEWSSLDHVPVTATVLDFAAEQEWNELVGTEESPLDYFHINSARHDDDGDLLISARHTHAVYKIDSETGELLWTLGGPESDFDLPEDAYFSWQHDAQREDDGTIRIFDNAATPAYRENSRVLWLDLDKDDQSVSIADQLEAPETRLSDYMANASRLDNGNLLVGWGWEHFYTEYNPDGEVVYDAFHGPFNSYRAYSKEWAATPAEPPALVIDGDTAYISWNGATEVAQWRLMTGEDEASATFHEVADKEGFETAIPAPTDAPYIAVQALNDSGEVLGASFVHNE